MSDEEKKAIERLNKRYEFFKENPLATNVWLTLDVHNLGIVLNLIEKQSKEIEELKEKNKKYTIHFTDKQYSDAIKLAQSVAISMFEAKIKAKIEEMDKEIKVKREIARNPMDRVSGRLLTDSIVELEKTKKVLQSLLEKE